MMMLGEGEFPLVSEEFGFRTIGFGWTEGQDLLTTAPQRDGLCDIDKGDIVLKKPPTGSSPSR